MKEKHLKSIELLKNYLEEVTHDEFLKDWEEVSNFGVNYGDITVEQFIQYNDIHNSILKTTYPDTSLQRKSILDEINNTFTSLGSLLFKNQESIVLRNKVISNSSKIIFTPNSKGLINKRSYV